MNSSPKPNIKNKIIFLNIEDEIDILITDYFQMIFSDTEINTLEGEILEQEMSSPLMQDKFAFFFSQIKCQKIQNINSINDLGKLINCYLDSSAK